MHTLTMHITLQAQLPLSQLPEFLQMIRTFEQHHNNLIIVAASAPEASALEIAKICDAMDPPFPLKMIIHR